MYIFSIRSARSDFATRQCKGLLPQVPNSSPPWAKTTRMTRGVYVFVSQLKLHSNGVPYWSASAPEGSFFAGVNCFRAKNLLRGPIGMWYETVTAVNVTVAGTSREIMCIKSDQASSRAARMRGRKRNVILSANGNGCNHTYDWPDEGENTQW